jgi:uncharacterized protein with HEPN domain
MPSPSEGSSRRDWRLYAQDMQRFAHRAVGYCAGLDRAQFEANQLMQDAVLRNLELIGEAATRIRMTSGLPTQKSPRDRSLRCAIN